MTRPIDPLAQSVKIGFRLLYAATALLALGWLTSNIRQVAADSRAVVLRFGRIDRVREAGLLLVWPQPVERVRLLPARERQIALRIAGSEPAVNLAGVSVTEPINAGRPLSPETDLEITPSDDVIQLRSQKDADNAGYLLTGDGSVVELDTTLFYEITDPAAYLLAETHVEPALRRLYQTSAVALAASRDLDDFLVARPDQDRVAGRRTRAPDVGTEAQRAALRGDLLRAINARLDALKEQGDDLGVTVSRVDIVADLPPIAKSAFDAVLTAAQTADQAAAAARTDAARAAREAASERDRILSDGRAVAEERVRNAMTDTAAISALEIHTTTASHNNVLAQYYREQIAAILRKAGDVTVIDHRGTRQLIFPGPTP
ncbi:MAG: SPFH domain-containing protein [Azospirillaceae bacterium]|nr:SPFH domain-containing protein [Azospirillaceae bacterium]